MSLSRHKLAPRPSAPEGPRPFPRWRSVPVFAFVIGVWLILIARLVQVQWLQRDTFSAQAERQRIFVQNIPARPGDILDRDGRLLATTITAKSLYVVPSAIEDPAAIANQLAGALGLDPAALQSSIDADRTRKFLWIKRRLADAEVDSVAKLSLTEGTWGLRDELLRRYPQGTLAAHVLGLRDIDGIGRGGIEQGFDEILRGRDGSRQLVRDARGKVIDIRGDVAAPVAGSAVTLTIDSVIQTHAERELDALLEEWSPHAACAIVIEPATGEILALASRPTFDPNNPTEAIETAWRNHAVASVFEPGSTLKPLVVAWALDHGAADRDETTDCENGEYRMGRRLLHDLHPHGELSLTDVLVHSSNIGMAKIGERLTNTELYRSVISFGFGRTTGSGLPGELPGLVRPLNQWNSYSTGSVPMGQELAVTPLQLAVAHAALANGGEIRRPKIIRQDERGADDTADPALAIVSRVVSEDSARWTVEVPMTEVVERGTGTHAKISGYRVFGKSGTAQKTDETGAYSATRTVCSFVVGGPSAKPRAIVLVMADEPTKGVSHYGGTVAGPAAARILERTLAHMGVSPAPTRGPIAAKP